jgi:MFS family permease
VFATALPLIGAAYPDARERTGAVAAFGATVAVAVAIGPLVGGALTEAFGWQAIFIVNVPVGVATLVAASRRLLDDAEPAAGQALDVPGMGLLGAGLFALVFATVRGDIEGWGSPVIVGSYALAVALLGGFLAVERGRRSAMIDLTLFRSRTFSAAGVAVLGLGGLIGALVPLTNFLQAGLGHGALQAGVELLPISGMSFVAAALTARVLGERVGAGTLLGGGLGLTAAGLALMTLVRDSPGFLSLLPGMVLAGLGWGTINVTATELSLAAVEPARAGMATGTLNVMRQVGLAAGIAALGAVFQGAARHGMADASADAFVVGAVVTGVGALAAAGLAGARASLVAKVSTPLPEPHELA